ncbi:uncharacterized protein LOC130247295 [Danio aesculapii]|uniref:uncharacterized protein LOC130247295 n=1 Tax=Danio aesculapii TaxID=1142201 RepID=UPI0024C0A1A3|nr:uncharacterized protein LOC130247295 [Danio aesculapii]
MMSGTQTPQSTCVDMPDVATPKWPVMSPVQNIHTLMLLRFTLTPLCPATSIQEDKCGLCHPLLAVLHCRILQGIQYPSPCNYALHEISPVFSNNQQELQLPHALPTPARKMQHLTSQVQGNWETLMNTTEKQEEAIRKLTHELKTASTHHTDQAANMATKIQENQQQVLTLLSTNKTQEDAETDQLTLAINLMLTTEVQKAESTIVSKMRFMVNRLQAEVQQDLKNMQQNLQKSHDQLTTEIQKCNRQTVDVCADFKKFQTEVTDLCKTQESKLLSMFKENKQSTTLVTLPASTQITLTSSIPVSAFPVAIGVRSDHLKLTFPTFGRPSDDFDPLLYVIRCQDILALHTLIDADILAMFCTVLYGTARDWWEVARTSVAFWTELESAFLLRNW